MAAGSTTLWAAKLPILSPTIIAFRGGLFSIAVSIFGGGISTAAGCATRVAERSREDNEVKTFFVEFSFQLRIAQKFGDI